MKYQKNLRRFFEDVLGGGTPNLADLAVNDTGSWRIKHAYDPGYPGFSHLRD